MKNILAFVCIFALTYSCSDKGTEPDIQDPMLSFMPDVITIASGNQTETDLAISDLQNEVFAISLQISFDPDIISFDETGLFTAGDFFSQSAITFIKAVYDKLFLTISSVQGSAPVEGSGMLGTIRFTAEASGSCALNINTSDLKFYDDVGNTIEIANLSIDQAEIFVN